MVGKIYGRLWTLLAFVILSGSVQGAHAASVDAYATAIARADQQRQALEQMRELADPAFKALLVALKEGRAIQLAGSALDPERLGCV